MSTAIEAPAEQDPNLAVRLLAHPEAAAMWAAAAILGVLGSTEVLGLYSFPALWAATAVGVMAVLASEGVFDKEVNQD